MMLFDCNGTELKLGDKVKILKCDYPNFIGKIFTIDNWQDSNNKIKVTISDQWQGYFYPREIEKVETHKKHKIDLNNEYAIFTILQNEHPNRIETLKVIRKTFVTLENIFNYLRRIDSNNNFSAKQWFEFGIYFSKQQ